MSLKPKQMKETEAGSEATAAEPTAAAEPEVADPEADAAATIPAAAAEEDAESRAQQPPFPKRLRKTPSLLPSLMKRSPMKKRKHRKLLKAVTETEAETDDDAETEPKQATPV